MTFKDFEFERKIYVFYLKEMPNKKGKREHVKKNKKHYCTQYARKYFFVYYK